MLSLLVRKTKTGPAFDHLIGASVHPSDEQVRGALEELIEKACEQFEDQQFRDEMESMGLGMEVENYVDLS
jgi:hypothetical protein